MSDQSLLYLSRKDVESLAIPMGDIIAALEDMFAAKGRGEVEMPPKPGVHPKGDAFIHAMPAYIPHLQAAGVKWVSGFPDNHKAGLPYISGLFILNDPQTGFPRAVMDCTWMTAERTGAATAVAAKYLARQDASSVGIIACGVQGRSNLRALSCVRPIEAVKAYDVHAPTLQRFCGEMAAELGVTIEVVVSPEDAVRDLDMVVTSGPILKDPSPPIRAGWLKPGAFASAVDFDSYFAGDALAQADIIATDDVAQLEYYRGEGYFRSTPKPHVNLGALAAGNAQGRANDSQRAIAINLGVAASDVAIAALIYDRAVQGGIGTTLPL